MNTTTTTAVAAPANRTLGDVRVSQWRVVISEWIKLRSLRSTVYTLLAAAVAVIGFGLLAAAAVSGQIEGRPGNGPRGGGFPRDPTSVSLAGVMLAQMIVGVLGVLVITGEYATGMIRSSLSAVPKRLPVLWGKVIVFTAVTLVVMLLAIFAAFFASQAILAGSDMAVALTDDGQLRALLGAAVYLTGIGVMGIALGTVLRNTAGAITTLFAALLVVPGLIALVLPDSWTESATPYLPSNAGQSFMAAGSPGEGMLDPAAGLAVFAAYIIVLLGTAALALTRRDA